MKMNNLYLLCGFGLLIALMMSLTSISLTLLIPGEFIITRIILNVLSLTILIPALIGTIKLPVYIKTA